MRFFPWNSGYAFADSDAAAYVAAVETADVQALEYDVKAAIDALFVGLKADGEWNAFGVLHCLAGPRTLAGLAVPMKGAAPTLVNFVSGDINRKTGLVGNGSTKYVNHNRNTNADGQDDQQMWSYLTNPITDNGSTQAVMGVGLSQNGTSHIGRTNGASNYFSRSRSSSTGTSIAIGSGIGLVGMSRNNSASYDLHADGVTQTNTITSQPPFSANIFSFGRNSSGLISPSNQRESFVGIGAAWTNPANIEARIDTYMAAISAAIP
jgi:hypothetical protein